jgi:hypothetical protein
MVTLQSTAFRFFSSVPISFRAFLASATIILLSLTSAVNRLIQPEWHPTSQTTLPSVLPRKQRSTAFGVVCIRVFSKISPLSLSRTQMWLCLSPISIPVTVLIVKLLHGRPPSFASLSALCVESQYMASRIAVDGLLMLVRGGGNPVFTRGIPIFGCDQAMLVRLE